MRNSSMALIAVALLSGCVTSKSKEEPKLTPDQQAAAARQDEARGTEMARKNFDKQKAAYEQSAKDDLNKLEARIATFNAQVISNKDDRDAHDKAVETMQASLASAREKLEALDNANADQWSDRQHDVEQAIMVTRAQIDANTARVAH